MLFRSAIVCFSAADLVPLRFSTLLAFVVPFDGWSWASTDYWHLAVRPLRRHAARAGLRAHGGRAGAADRLDVQCRARLPTSGEGTCAACATTYEKAGEGVRPVAAAGASR